MYELTYLINAGLQEIDSADLIKKIKQTIIQLNGEITQEITGQKIRLAYQIKKQQEGFLICLNFQIAPENLEKVEQQLKHEKDILRYLITIKKILKPKTISQKAKTKAASRPIKDKAEMKELDKKIEEILNE